MVTLNEGSTPLIEAPRLSERIGVRAYLKFEGANPTGSFKDRGMTVAVSRAKGRGAEAVICASTGNTAASAAAYAARAGMRGAVIVPEGKIAIGKLAQALMHGARVVALQGNFDDALRIVRELADKHPIELVNSVNPYRIEGQKTAAFEVVEELGEAPGALAIPVGNAGNVTAYWRGFQEVGAAPVLYGFQAEGAAPLVHGAPVAEPETVASAIRIGNPARWEEAMDAFTASRGRVAAVSDEQILDAYRWLAAERRRLLRARLGRLGRRPARPRPARRRGRRAARDRRLRAHRPRPQGPRHRPLQSAGGGQLRERPQRGRARRLRCDRRRRLVRVPASSANLGPGYDVMAAAVSLYLELEVEEAGEFSFDPGGPTVSTGRDNLVVRAFESLHPADGIAFRLRSEIPLARGLGSSAAAIVAGLFAADHLFELALSKEEMLARATELEGHPDNVAASIYGGFVVCGAERGRRAERGPLRPARAGSRAIAVIPAEEVSTERAREAIPAEIPLADAVANVSAASRLVLGLQRGRPRPRRPRPRRPHPPGAPPRPLPALDGAGRLGRRAGRPRRDDLRRRPDRPRLDHLAGRRQGRRGAGARAAPAGPRSAACPSAPRRRRPRAVASPASPEPALRSRRARQAEMSWWRSWLRSWRSWRVRRIAQATLVYVRNPLHPTVYAAQRQRLRRAQGRAGLEPRASRPTGRRSPTCTKAPATLRN